MTKMRMKADSDIEPKAVKGTIVFDLILPDYGLHLDDERGLGFPCRSVTLDPAGGYPFFVVPEHDLEPAP